MKLLSTVAAIVTLFGVCSQVTAHINAQSKGSSPSSPLFSIRVTPPSPPIHLGVPLEVEVTVKNVSGREIYWVYAKSDIAYKAFHVLLQKDGHEVDTTFFHRKITGRQRPDDPTEVDSGGSIALPLAADQSFTWKLDLTRLYNIQTPGDYILEICRPDEYSKTKVCAKSVTLKVVP